MRLPQTSIQPTGLGGEEVQTFWYHSKQSKHCYISDPHSPTHALMFVKPAATCPNPALPVHKELLLERPKAKHMAHPSHLLSFLRDPTSSPQGSTHSAGTTSMPDSGTTGSLPLLIQYQTGTLHSPTTGHTFIYVPPFPPTTLPSLTKIAIQALRETQNPNNNHVIPGTAIVECLIVHWGIPVARPGGLTLPSTSRLSEESLEVVLSYLRWGRGYDFVEIRFRELVGNPPLGSFPIGPPSKAAASQASSKKMKGQGDKGNGAERGFQVPAGLDYNS